MPWIVGPNGAKMFVPKGRFERYQSEQFWAGFKGGLSGLTMQALQATPNQTVRITIKSEPTTDDQQKYPLIR